MNKTRPMATFQRDPCEIMLKRVFDVAQILAKAQHSHDDKEGLSENRAENYRLTEMVYRGNETSARTV